MKLMVTVLMLLTLGAEGKLVKDFTDKDTDPACKQFFLNGEPPKFKTGTVSASRYKHICQKYKNKYYYATLYDTTEKIPLYSAYQFKEREDCTIKRPDITWKIEPQLEDQNKGDEMALKNQMKVNNQAINSEYEDSSYHRGHLFPVCHTDSDEAAESTFTLTNAAPQKETFNNLWYKKVEDRVRIFLICCLEDKNTAFVVTGVVPSAGTNKQTLKNEGKVNVPSHFWTGYCCCDNNNKCKFGGFIMDENKDKPEKFVNKSDEFHKKLKELYSLVSVTVFDETCVRGVDDSPLAKKPRVN